MGDGARGKPHAPHLNPQGRSTCFYAQGHIARQTVTQAHTHTHTQFIHSLQTGANAPVAKAPVSDNRQPSLSNHHSSDKSSNVRVASVTAQTSPGPQCPPPMCVCGGSLCLGRALSPSTETAVWPWGDAHERVSANRLPGFFRLIGSICSVSPLVFAYIACMSLFTVILCFKRLVRPPAQGCLAPLHRAKC